MNKTEKIVWLASLGFLVLLFSSVLVQTIKELPSNISKVESTKLSPTPSPTSTPAPAPSPTPEVKGTTKATPSQVNDPIVDCKFPHSGIKKLKSSECSASVDCQIGDKWVPLTKPECTRAQDELVRQVTELNKQRTNMVNC